MFSLILLIVCVALAGFFIFLAIRWKNEGFVVLAVIACIIFLIVGVINLDNFSRQIGDFTTLKALDKKITLYSDRRDNLTNIVRTELSKYPEYEKTIMGNINPQILLSFPQLKSNETMLATVKQILELQDKVYDLQKELIEIQQGIYYREISPWIIYVTPYEKFFGKSNPLLTK